jgi:hypothetical protein
VDLTLAENKLHGRGSYLETGPPRSYANDRERYRDFADVWRRSTKLLYESSRAHGIVSFHFLQPNQRVPGSKIFGPGEEEIALPRRHGYDEPARRGYPFLRRAAAALKSEGVEIEDLTMIFSDVEAPLYVDGCCHVNRRGSQMIASAIAKTIRRSFRMSGDCNGMQTLDSP